MTDTWRRSGSSPPHVAVGYAEVDHDLVSFFRYATASPPSGCPVRRRSPEARAGPVQTTPEPCPRPGTFGMDELAGILFPVDTGDPGSVRPPLSLDVHVAARADGEFELADLVPLGEVG